MPAPDKPTEVIYQPDPSWLPVIAAAGVAGLVVGLFTWWPWAALGAVTALYGLAGWIKQVRADISRMPRTQQVDTAPVPLSGVTPRD